MFEKIYTYVTDKAQFVHETYGVDPLVFLIMSVVLTGPYYYSIYRLIRSITSRDKKQFVFWGTFFLILVIIPYLYILIWGHNLPWYIFVIIIFLLLNGLYALIRKLRKKQSERNNRDDMGNSGNK